MVFIMETTTKEWFEKEAGNWSLGLLLVIAFLGTKFAICGFDLIIVWDTLWFIAIILSALAADLFSNAGTWTENSYKIIENEKLTKEERMSMIQSQLEVAVNRYMAVFLMVNGFDSLLKKFGATFNKVFNGKITIKEIIVILSYALYNIILKDTNLDIGHLDEALLFIVIVAIKIVDANAGVAKLIAEMYLEAKATKDPDKYLLKVRERIIELAHIYHIETIE